MTISALLAVATLAPSAAAVQRAPALAFKAGAGAPVVSAAASAARTSGFASLVPALSAAVRGASAAPALSGAIDADGNAVAASAALAAEGARSAAAASDEGSGRARMMSVEELLRLLQQGGAGFDGAEQKPQAEEPSATLEPKIESRHHAWGRADAPHTLVVYSDMNCPDSRRSAGYEKSLMERYGEELRIVYKHNPLPFHQFAPLGAALMEAVALQSPEKAKQFARDVYDPKKMEGATSWSGFYRDLLVGLGIDMERLQKDLDSEEVRRRVEEDMAEAASFGFRGTPSFVLDGKPIKGRGGPEKMVEAVEAAIGK